LLLLMAARLHVKTAQRTKVAETPATPPASVSTPEHFPSVQYSYLKAQRAACIRSCAQLSLVEL
jgi:hypothetical protein